ncbi:MAG: ASPIC/UnbV domain-containing protein [Verrucomicrobiota bacterium]
MDGIDRFSVVKQGEDGGWIVQSFSGHETNRLFMNRMGESFDDASALSGLDSDKDGRMFAMFDYDRDGWQDLVLVNSNSPQLEIYRNGLKQRAPSKTSIGFRLIGGSESAKPNPEWSNRDAFGAVVRLKVDGKTHTRELRCGEGFATQNSKMLHFGLGESTSIEAADIRWPSGRKQSLNGLVPGTIVTVKEGGEHRSEPFESQGAGEVPSKTPGVTVTIPGLSKDKPAVLVTTATWCGSCKENLAQVALLKEHYGDEFDFIGLPVDPNDTEEKLAKYTEVNQPAYRIMSSLGTADRETLSNVVTRLTGKQVLPSTLIIDPSGEILAAKEGVPPLSALRRLLHEEGK